MSDDAAYIVRQNGVDRFTYARWGASHLGRDLLQGPDAFAAFLDDLPVLDEIPLVRWLNAIVIVDSILTSCRSGPGSSGIGKPPGRSWCFAFCSGNGPRGS